MLQELEPSFRCPVDSFPEGPSECPGARIEVRHHGGGAVYHFRSLLPGASRNRFRRGCAEPRGGRLTVRPVWFRRLWGGRKELAEPEPHCWVKDGRPQEDGR